jgi:curved DNA-binding protein CbpA
MTIEKAMKLLEVDNFNLDDIKKKYKKLIRKYHPDLNAGVNEDICKDLNEAYEIVTNALNDISYIPIYETVQKKPLIILSIEQLEKLYEGQILEINGLKVRKGNRDKFNLFVETSGVFEHNGAVVNYNKILPWDMSDKYEVDYTLETENLDSEHTVNVSLYNKQIKLTLKSGKQSIKIVLHYKYNITLSLRIIRRISLELEKDGQANTEEYNT